MKANRSEDAGSGKNISWPLRDVTSIINDALLERLNRTTPVFSRFGQNLLHPLTVPVPPGFFPKVHFRFGLEGGGGLNEGLRRGWELSLVYVARHNSKRTQKL